MTNNNPIILSLDAGGTNFVFSAMQSGEILGNGIIKKASPDSIDITLETIVQGFKQLISNCMETPAAISFGFPGPCDYKNGIVGNLPNFPAFEGELALGPYLKEKFGIPVFIENDGNLFTLGEYTAGFLPFVNRMLSERESSKQYKNLIGVTIGTGFGCGVVINGTVLSGDNDAGGEIWCTASSLHPGDCAEAYVGRNSLISIFKELSGSQSATNIEPKDLYSISLDQNHPDSIHAIKAFEIMGNAAGDALANCLSIIDGLIVVGGGLSGAYSLFVKSMLQNINDTLVHRNGNRISRVAYPCYNLEDETEAELFLKRNMKSISLPGSDKGLPEHSVPKTCIGLSKLGTSNAVFRGAYEMAMREISG